VVWVRLKGFNYSRTALYLPEKYRKEAMYEAHDSIFGGHNVTQKNVPQNLHLVLLAKDISRH
jgi:hypothetical protein